MKRAAQRCQSSEVWAQWVALYCMCCPFRRSMSTLQCIQEYKSKTTLHFFSTLVCFTVQIWSILGSLVMHISGYSLLFFTTEWQKWQWLVLQVFLYHPWQQPWSPKHPQHCPGSEVLIHLHIFSPFVLLQTPRGNWRLVWVNIKTIDHTLSLMVDGSDLMLHCLIHSLQSEIRCMWLQQSKIVLKIFYCLYVQN